MAYFVGGDTAELTYDFYTKTANSMVNCPLEIYEGEVDPNNLPNPSGELVYQDSNAAIVYTGTWSSASSGAYNGGTARHEGSAGSKLELTFYGTGIKFISCKGSNRGIANIYIDNILMTTVDTYFNGATYSTQVYEKLDLINGTHTIKVEVSGNKNASSSDTLITMDTLIVVSPWRKITDQARIDKLKEQNDIPLTGVADANFQYTLDGVTYDDNAIHIVDDLKGKIRASTVENPNIIKYDTRTTLQLPDNFANEAEGSLSYSSMDTLDGNAGNLILSTPGQISQALVIWDLLEIVKRKCGPMPSDNPIQWLKDNIDSIMCNVTCRGDSAYGYYAELQVFSVPEQIYAPYGTLKTNTSSVIATLSEGSINYKNLTYKMIDDLGKVKFEVSTKACRTTSDTFVVFSSPHNLVTSDLIHNTTRSTSALVNGYYVYNFKASAVTVYRTDTAELSTSITGQVAGDSLDTYTPVSPFVTAEMGTNAFSIYKTNHGVPVGTYGFVKNISKTSNYEKVYATNANQLTLLNSYTGTTGQTSGDRIIIYKAKESGKVLSNTVIQSKLYIDYASVEIVFKTPKNYVTVSDNVVFSNYADKVYNSTVINANKAMYKYGSTVLNPVDFGTEMVTDYYSYIKVLGDGNVLQPAIRQAGQMAQMMFQLDVVKAVEKKYGTIPATDKIAWIKANGIEVKFNHYGYSGYTGFIRHIKVRYFLTDTWENEITSNASSITKATLTVTSSQVANRIDSNGQMYFIVHTDAGDGVSETRLFNDYVDYEITLNPATSYKILTPVNNRRDAGQAQLLLTDITTKEVYKYFTKESLDAFCNVVGKSKAYLIELDLSSVANLKFGGSSTNLRSAFKDFKMSLFAMAYGTARDTEMEYKTRARVFVYSPTTLSVVDNWGLITWGISPYHTNDSISELVLNTSADLRFSSMINSSNKMHIILYSENPASASIPSVLALDFVKTQFWIARTVDIPMYYDKVSKNYLDHINAEIGDTWAIMLKGYSPSWVAYTNIKKFFALVVDANNYLVTQISSTSNKITVAGRNSGVDFISNTTVQMPYGIKYKSSSLMFVLDNKNKQMRVYILYDGVITKYVINSIDEFKSKTSPLYILNNTPNIQQADAYIDRPYIFNNKDFLDEEIEVMMRGRNSIIGKETDAHLNQLAEIYKNPNMLPLFNDARWTKHANARVNTNGDILTLVATANSQASSIAIPLLPNNKYKLYLKATAGKIYYTFNIGSYVKESHDLYQTNGIIELEFTAAENVNNMLISVQNGSLGAGTYVFSDMELRRLD